MHPGSVTTTQGPRNFVQFAIFARGLLAHACLLEIKARWHAAGGCSHVGLRTGTFSLRTTKQASIRKQKSLQ